MPLLVIDGIIFTPAMLEQWAKAGLDPHARKRPRTVTQTDCSGKQISDTTRATT